MCHAVKIWIQYQISSGKFAIFQVLKRNNIYLTVNKFSQRKSVPVGIIAKINPMIANIREIYKQISKLAKTTIKSKNKEVKRYWN